MTEYPCTFIFLKHRFDPFIFLSRALDSSPTAFKTESRASECVWSLTNFGSLRTMPPTYLLYIGVIFILDYFSSSKAGFFSECFVMSSTCPPD